jgi:aryl-alcohol dehydrogenase-like predicted oxidoreductase
MKLTRRELIGGAGGVAALSLGGGLGSLFAADAKTHHTTIPSTGQTVPSVGLGTNRYRGDVNSPDMDNLRATLRIFGERGAKVIDTSPNYGNSEQVLAHLLNELNMRREVFMATKVDREDAEDGLQRMESSFGRLGEPIDLMQVHNLRGTDVQLGNMKDWKARGRFRYIGITTHRVAQHAEMEQVMRTQPLDFIQVNYSLADRAAADRILPLAMDRGIAVLVNRPFANGRLFGAVKGKDLPAWAAEIDASSWGQVFLKWIISHPAATIPIPGTTKPHHAEDNLQAMVGRMPDEAMRREMGSFFDKIL